jgi:UDP:flavonoid glycosyltransferase YjiC (YdhE family)
MGRVLLAWELGGGYGHLAPLTALARALREYGHEPMFVFKDLSRAHAIAGIHEFPLLQAPIWLPQAVGTHTPVSYSELLALFGYLQVPSLSGLVAAWRNLYDLLKPDLIVFDYSPTALLAASGLNVAKVLFGMGFWSPPKKNPLPAMRWWQKVPPERLAQSDRQVLEAVNTLLLSFGCSPLNQLADLFNVDEDFLCTFPELDHYPDRESGVRYWGPLFSQDAGGVPHWPSGDGEKIFAYLNSGYRGLTALLSTLRALPYQVLVHCPGAAKKLIDEYRSKSLDFCLQAMNMRTVCEQADLLICHGPGSASAMLLAGKPVLSLPTQLEQHMWAMRMEQTGAGKKFGLDEPNPNYRAAIRSLLTDERFRQSAQDFAARHADFNPGEQLRSMVARCDELIRQQENINKNI